MAGFFEKMKEKLAGSNAPSMDEQEEGYVELGADEQEAARRYTVRPFVLDDFESVKPILDSLREGLTICLVNIKPLKDKDIVELKRAINKLKKTTDAIEGDIAGFGDNWIAAVPPRFHIHRSKGAKVPAAEEAKRETAEVTEYE